VEETEEAQCCCQACVRLTDRPAGPRRASLVCVWLSYNVYTCICACVLMQSGTHTHLCPRWIVCLNNTSQLQL